MRFALPLLALVLATPPALAQTATVDATEAKKQPPRPAVGWSTELLDPIGLTRFHLTSRGIFASRTGFGVEAKVQFRVADGVALSATLPFAIDESDGTVGNIAAGFTWAGTSGDHAQGFDFGGGLDVYLPVAGKNVGNGLIAALRAYEPMLYVPDLFSFRTRGYAAYRTPQFFAALELGLVPAFSLEGEGGTSFLLSAAGRVGATLGAVEPFLEVAAAPQIAGDGEIAPPLLVTPGVRFHIADIFDPALFVSFNFVEASAIIVGLDLALAFRPGEKDRLEKSYEDDFLDGGF
ncbi:MAG: hypothetical protein RIT81_28860 [Deltaproteobacteria bacterium]